MPDVGVLNLTIKDNSEQAGQGLSELARALSAVKTAMADFTLSKVGQQVKNLATKIGETQGSNAVIKNLTGMFNALSNYSKIKNLTIDTEPIEKLKTALGTGINVGKVGTEINKLREAFTGDWGDESKVAFITGSMEGLAAGSERLASSNAAAVIRDVSKSIEKYASAIGQVSGGGAHDYLTQQIFNAVGTDTTSVGTNITSGISQGVEQGKEEAVSATIDVADAMIESAKGRFGIASPSKEFERIGEYCMEGLVQGLVKTRSEVQHSLVQVAEDAKESISTAMNPSSMGGGFRKYMDDVNAVVHVLREYRDLALSMESKKDIAGFNKKSGEELIASMQTAKENVAEVAGNISTVAEATEKAATAAEAVGTKIEQTTEKAKESAKEVKGYYASIEDAFNGIRNGKKVENDLMSSWLHGNGTKGEQDYGFRTLAKDLGMSIDEVRQKVNELLDAEKRLADQTANIGTSGTDAADKTKEQLTTTAQASQDTTDRFKQLTDAQEETTKSVFSLHDAYSSLKSGIKAMFPTITSLIKRFTSMAKMRMLRYVIREIAKGFKEGVQNVYEYSKAIGSGFAPSMDSAASALAQMKNSIGAAAAPLLQSLIPVLKQVVDWFINILNYANQFFALLNGQKTWTRALPQTTEAFGKQEKAAKKTGAAIKDLLADWDELNIIQSNTSGAGAGAGTSTAEDYLSMFEEVSKFDEKIEKIVDFIKDNIGDVLNIAKEIGLAILGWKFSNAFTGILGKLGSLLTVGLIVELSADVTSLIDQAYIENEVNGLLIGDLVLNGAMAAIAGKLASVALGKGPGEIAAGITLAVSAGATLEKAQEAKELGKDSAATMLGITAAIKGAIAGVLSAAGFLAWGASLPLSIVAGVATVGIAMTLSFAISYEAHSEEDAKTAAEEAFKAKGEGGIDPEAYHTALQTKLDELTAGSTLVINSHVDFPNLRKQLSTAAENINALTYYISGDGKLSAEDAEAFKKNWNTVFETLNKMSEASFNTILSGLNESLADAVGTAKEHIAELRLEFIELEQNVNKQTAEMYKEMEDIVDRLTQNKYGSDTERDADIERYAKLAEAIRISTDTTFDAIQKQIDSGKNLDFSKSGLEGVKEWINNVEQADKDAQEKLDEALRSYTESVNFERKRIESLVYLDEMTPEQAEAANAMLDRLIETYTDTIEKKKGEAKDKINEAYSEVMKTAFAGDISANDWYYVIVPMLEEIKKAGGEIPGWVTDKIKEGMRWSLTEGSEGLNDSFFAELFGNKGINAEGAVDSIYKQIDSLVKNNQGAEYLLNIMDMFNLSAKDILSDDFKQEIIRQAVKAGHDVDFINDLCKALGIDINLSDIVTINADAQNIKKPKQTSKNWLLNGLVSDVSNTYSYWGNFVKQQQDASNWTLPDEYNTAADAEAFVKNGGVMSVESKVSSIDESVGKVSDGVFNLLDPIKGVYNWLVQNGTNTILFWNEFLKQQQEAGEWTLPDEYNTVKDAEEFVKNGGIIPVVEEKKKYDYSGDWVQGDDFTISDAEEFIKGYNERDALKQLYNDLVGQLNSSDLGLSDKTDYLKYLMELYTNKDLERMKQELEILTENGWGSDNYRHGLGNGSIRNPNNYAAAVPTNQFVYPNRTGAEGDEDLSGDVEKGTRAANKTSEDLIRQGVNYLWQLLNKPTNFTVTPSAAWGQHNAKSNDKYTYITGVEMV